MTRRGLLGTLAAFLAAPLIRPRRILHVYGEPGRSFWQRIHGERFDAIRVHAASELPIIEIVGTPDRETKQRIAAWIEEAA